MVSLASSFRLLYAHLGLGLIAAVLFGAGLVTSLPVVRRDLRWLMAFPLWVVRQVLRLIGPNFAAVRVFLTIFFFNSLAIFLYMASGVLVVLPAAVAFLTGLNIGVIVLRSGEVEMPSGERPLAEAMDPNAEHEVAPWVSLCSVTVLVLELPSFWISVGMGIGMARELTRVGGYTLATLRALLEPRVAAYLSIIVPALLLSALAETAAIRGHVRARRPPD
jgi:hypothetical protein